MNRLILLLGLLLSFPAWAQLPPGPSVQQKGSVTAGNCATWTSTGAIQDAGYACTGGAAGPYLPLAGGTLTGSLAFADGAAWGASGLADTASYSTASTSFFNLTPTWSFSSTSNGVSPIILSPTMVPTGASAGNINGIVSTTTIGTSSVNIATARNYALSTTVSAGYSGTITTLVGMLASVTNNGTNPAGTAQVISINGLANGNGITSGTVTNELVAMGGSSASAASGGTITNNGLRITLGTGSGAGTTMNRGVYITGNGGTGGGGTTNNYALYSDSTAPSLLSGVLTVAGYAVGSLPASPATGSVAYVTDQLTACPSLGGTFTGGGGVKCLAFYNGSAWIYP